MKLAMFQLEGESQIWWDWSLKRLRGHDMRRVLCALHGKVLPHIFLTCKGFGVLGIKTRNNDSA